MKHCIIGVSLVLGVFFIAPTPVAHAWSWSSFFGRSSHSQGRHHARGNSHSRRWSYGKSHQRSHSSVPELDAGAAGSAVVLLLGGVAYILSRRREEEIA